MKMKREFELQEYNGDKFVPSGEKMKIIGQAPKHLPYVTMEIDNCNYYIPDKDLERFAVNILKALGSKKLK